MVGDERTVNQQGFPCGHITKSTHYDLGEKYKTFGKGVHRRTISCTELTICTHSSQHHNSSSDSRQRERIEQHRESLYATTDLSDLIWDLAEVGYQETRSSEALKARYQQRVFPSRAVWLRSLQRLLRVTARATCDRCNG